MPATRLFVVLALPAALAGPGASQKTAPAPAYSSAAVPSLTRKALRSMKQPKADFTRISIQPGSDMTLSLSAAEPFARQAQQVAGSGSEYARAERLWRWAVARYEYTPTPRHRTLDALLADTGGNCMDHATLLLALFQAAGRDVVLAKALEIASQP